ncbi:MAG: hypothetical protein HRT87_05710 [Legionellales bacterium]|nr:hypothetical protein [Legionellales bacterium]
MKKNIFYKAIRVIGIAVFLVPMAINAKINQAKINLDFENYNSKKVRFDFRFSTIKLKLLPSGDVIPVVFNKNILKLEQGRVQLQSARLNMRTLAQNSNNTITISKLNSVTAIELRISNVQISVHQEIIGRKISILKKYMTIDSPYIYFPFQGNENMELNLVITITKNGDLQIKKRNN